MWPAKPVDLLAKPRATDRCEARVAVLTERRRRSAHAAPILQHSGTLMRLGRPCVVGSVQVAPTPRIRPREVKRCGGGEAHGASNSQPSNLKLALVAFWHGLALCAESSRHIWHIRIVNARPGARTRLRSTGRPLPAYSRRLESLQAARSLCDAYGMHASRWQQQACVWNAASGGRCVRYHGDHCDPSEVAAPNGVRLQPVGSIWVYPASPLTTGRRDVRGRPR